MPSITVPELQQKPVVLATLPALRLDLVKSKDRIESLRLLDACRHYGFFYLDLSSSRQLMEDWESVLDFAGEYFAQLLGEKMRDSRRSDTEGYEPVGTSAGATLTEVDAYESLKVSEAEMRRSELNIASGLARSRSELFFRFISSAREVTILLLGLLSDELGLRGASRLESYHTRGESLSTMAMFKYPKHDATSSSRSGVGHNPHTDLGTFTLLLARQWGLQVLSPDTESWAFVAPRANHALINVGDSLRALSRFQFAAVVHRVFPVQEQQHEDRYSIAYFLRVNDDVELPNVVGNDDGKVCSAKAWHDYKFGVFRAPMASPQAMRDLTGGMEKDGKLIGR